MYTVTRSKTDHLVLDDRNNLFLLDPGVSVIHAWIHLDSASRITIEDAISTNGTFVNGKKMENSETIVLNDGDKVTFGHRDYRFEQIEEVIDVPKINDLSSSEDEKSLPKKPKIRRVENERGK